MSEKKQPLSVRLKESIADKGYAAGWAFVKILPPALATKLFDYGADVAARNAKALQLRKNLIRVLGVATVQEVPEDLIRQSYRSYARYWREVFRLPTMHIDEVFTQLEEGTTGAEHLEQALKANRGVVLALPHSGNWDMAGVWLVQRYGTFSTVAERLKPESLYQRFVDFRESLGFHVIPLTGAKKPPFAQLKDTLQNRGIVCLMGERDLRARGIEVTFFGEKTRFPAGPAKLAKDTGAALLPVHCYFTDNGWGLTIEEPLNTDQPLDAITQDLAVSFEKNIATHPADWHMLQPLWLDDLSESHRAHIENPNTNNERKG